MTIALVQTAKKALGANGGTTVAASFSGTDLIVVCVSYDKGVTIAGGDISDSTGANTYTALTEQAATTTTKGRIFYAWNATVSASLTVTVTKASSFSSVVAYGFSGTQTSSDPFDVQNGIGTDIAGALQTGSVSPSLDGAVIVTCYNDASGLAASTINSSFNTSDFIAFGSGINYPIDASYKIQVLKGAENPTWTPGTGGGLQHQTANIAVFKAAVAGGVSNYRFRALLGVGL